MSDRGEKVERQLKELVDATRDERQGLREQLSSYREKRRRYDAQRGATGSAAGYRLHRSLRGAYRV
ncbi:MAG TPA: hypothetical protein VG820_05225 [Fimbriimonadaceae bacterium]|nr:hypothetical protein [Fimbriimonadaceae bacterium]